MIRKRIATLGVAFHTPDPHLHALLEQLTQAFAPLPDNAEAIPCNAELVPEWPSCFHLLLDGEHLVYTLTPDVFATLQHHLTLTLAGLPDRAFLHAAALERDGEVVVLAGESMAGKTTLAAALLAEGFRFLGDDIIPLSLHEDSLEPCPFPLRIRAEAREHLGPLEDHLRWIGEPFEARGQMTRCALPLPHLRAPHRAWPVGLFVFPAFGPHQVERLSSGAGSFRIMGAILNGAALLERGFERAVALGRSVPCYTVQTPNYRESITQILELWSER